MRGPLADADGVQRIGIAGGGYFFKPAHIVVRANVPVELASRESGITPHNLVIWASPVNIQSTAGRKLPFLAGHREKGMEALLEVVP